MDTELALATLGPLTELPCYHASKTFMLVLPRRGKYEVKRSQQATKTGSERYCLVSEIIGTP